MIFGRRRMFAIEDEQHAEPMSCRLFPTCLLLAVVSSLISCSSPEFKESVRVASPNGWVEAYVLEWSYGQGNGRTQVMLAFDGGRCGRGSVSANGIGLGLKLRWVEPATLQITHPESVDLERSPGGEDVQCGNRKVRVILSSSTAS
jgi:hypothetical protein